MPGTWLCPSTCRNTCMCFFAIVIHPPVDGSCTQRYVFHTHGQMTWNTHGQMTLSEHTAYMKVASGWFIVAACVYMCVYAYFPVQTSFYKRGMVRKVSKRPGIRQEFCYYGKFKPMCLFLCSCTIHLFACEHAWLVWNAQSFKKSTNIHAAFDVQKATVQGTHTSQSNTLEHV